MTYTDPMPTEDRVLLAMLFAEAEGLRLGTLNVGFTAAPGRKEEAAAYIAARNKFLERWTWGVPMPQEHAASSAPAAHFGSLPRHRPDAAPPGSPSPAGADCCPGRNGNQREARR
jgi:hypothetical protein